MTFPEKIRIGPFDWQIELIEDRFLSHSRRVGEIDFNDLTIKLCLKNDKQRIAETLIHEILHGIIHTNPVHKLDDELEESVVINLAYGLSSVIRDNPGLFGKIEALQTREE
jgi:hypothetical protein